MIGSDTLIVKDNGQFSAYIFSGLGMSLILFPPKDPYKKIVTRIKKLPPDRKGLTAEEVDKIKKANSANPAWATGEYRYHALTGDFVVLLDRDAKKVFMVDSATRNKGNFDWKPLESYR